MMKRLAICLLGMLVLACSVEVPHDVISPDRMERILYDYHQAQGMAETDASDVEAQRFLLTQKVFEKYGITEAEFDTSMVWYCGHARYLNEMYQHIQTRMEQEASRLGVLTSSTDAFSNLTAYGDTALIWQSHNVCLLNRDARNIVICEIPVDSTFRQGDTFMLRFGNRFVVSDYRKEGYAMLVAYYDNDSTTAVNTRIGGDFDSNIQIRPSALTREHLVKRLQVCFYFNYEDSQRDAFRLWMVLKPSVVRFHHDVDSLNHDADTAVDTLNASADTLRKKLPVPNREPRLSPEEMRNAHEVEHKINVVRQRKVVLPKQGVARKKVVR